MKIFSTLLSTLLLITAFAATGSAEDDATPTLSTQRLQQDAFLNAYIKAWDEKDDAKRLTIIKTFWTKDSIYLDPASHAVGLKELNKMIGTIRQQYPVWIGTHGKVYSTGNYFAYSWKINGADNKTLFEGYDTIKLDDNGKAIEVIGFF